MPAIDIIIGPAIQMAEAASLGMPFEVWKTRMGRHRTETTVEALKNVYKTGGGIHAFERHVGENGRVWDERRDIDVRERGNKREFVEKRCGSRRSRGSRRRRWRIAQVSVMGPCTYLVTGAVNDPSGKSSVERIKETYARSGVKGFYPGGTAIAFRQATNWASRQGFTEIVREKAKAVWYPDVDSKEVKMTKGQEVICGVIGGTMACWNHPFEVARIEAQTRGSLGQETGSMVSVMKDIVKENGVGGLFQRDRSRVGLGIWQTLFMVTGAKILKDELKERGLLESSGGGGH